MKKASIAIALTAAISLILASCVDYSKPEPEPDKKVATREPSEIVDIPWADSEFTGYVIQDYEGNNKGTVAMSIERYRDIYSLKQLYVFQDNVSLVLIANVRADNLKPLGGGVTESNVAFGPTTTYSYEEGGKLNIDAASPEGVQHIVMDVPEDAYDDNELLFLLRTLPFEVGYSTAFTNIIVASAKKWAVRISVVSKEEIQVPAGNFDTYKIKLTMAGETKHLWYGRSKPHHLIKLNDGVNLLLLKEIIK